MFWPSDFLLITLFAIHSVAATPEPEPATRPITARELYNAGTGKLRDGKLEEAQDLLRAAAQRNDDAIMPSAVYNLGHARYEIGERELLKTLASPQGNEVPTRAT